MLENNRQNTSDIRAISEKETAELNGVMNNTLRNEFVQAAANVFFIFKGFVDAGFTEKQALQLVGSILNGGKNENTHNKD